MIRHKLNFKGQTLLYFKTNHGSLFSVRTLLSIIRKRYVNNESMARYIRPELCVLVKRGSQHGTLCTGLKGVRQLFADRPNKQLEELLLSNGIVKGEMPCAADVKVIEESDAKFNEALNFVIKQQKQLFAAQQQIKYLEKKISVLEKVAKQYYTMI